ncbi:MAG: hypothetical protein DWQ01_03560 [Planctomycetota bacterium]|nr:MAG: hypothetical protein DWQ01_03560 [Planctomycetota bacterium]
MEKTPVIRGFLLISLLLLLWAPEASAQKKSKKVRCTVCLHDPELMQRNGVSHGPFPFGRSSSEEVQIDLLWDAVWLESAHFRFGLMLKSWKVPESERKAYRAELEALQEKYPAIKPKKAVLDPWLRAHLLVERSEAAYAKFLDLMGTSEAEFQDQKALTMKGLGPYLGMHEKFEIMVFIDKEPFKEYMEKTWGLTYVKPQRWNNVDRRCLWFGLNQEEENIRHDQHLHNIVLHNIGHNMLDGYQFYSYDLPVWITEGFAHWFERDNDPRFNMFDTVEGSFHEAKSLERWAPEVRKLVMKNEAASFSSLLRRASFAELGFEDHLVCWSKIDFLIRTDKAKFGQFITTLKSRRNAQGLPDASNMDGAQRQAFRDFYGWSLPQLEEKWKAWVLDTYPLK